MVYYLSLGANLGNRELTIRQALDMIEQQAGHILRCSTFYYSAPWGFESANEFCNLCCALQTDKQPLEVLAITQQTEKDLGRKKKSIDGHYSDRPIDIDLIMAFDDSGKEIRCDIPNPQPPVSDHETNTGAHVSMLTLPHPLWQERDFVKVPLVEIMQ
ncbi:MAG: 2-amino-4-hydroxy-6-hydroxymethyldihydropteridine diphosphokinase [Paludibacteraceae bacterium]|nr:2-amino-4-hydroxy-6-hydroxymethyldihydropteridine diphosphokinase [Paludibacteraceae bacterium]